MLSRTALCINHQALSHVNAVSQSQRILLRHMHITCQIRNVGIKCNSSVKLSKYTPVLGTCTKRYSSTAKVTNEAISSTTNNVSTSAVADGLTSKLIENIPAESPMTQSFNNVNNVTTETIMPATIDNISAESVEQNLADDTLSAEEPMTNSIETLPTTTLDVISNVPTGASTPQSFLDLPDAPVPPVVEAISYVGEPSLVSLGLGSWWPSGIVQQSLEWLHISCGLPWWESIMIGTLALRLALFPLVIFAQKNNAALSNNMPELARIQAEMTDARLEGDQLGAARKAQELMKFMKGKNCNPAKGLIVPLCQAPIFISVFFGIRQMANLPVESMAQGGLWWFTDLTCADPYYLLPILTTLTLSATIELGTDGTNPQSLGMMRYVLRAMPFVFLPFTLNFPAAILCYWCSSNFFSLIQVGLLKIPKVRTFFNIPAIVKHPQNKQVQKKGFVESAKTSMSNIRTTREMRARYVADEVQFHRAGRGPVQQTFSYDPTKQFHRSDAVQAKKR
ncbi:mitochondrial inner membrane protein OXA1L isoform X2 [Venturia canescens]|uniref:mitochondrial inner membrane protein OXA1L isoform X2 n=1 Tax=Venturia canescens TaxID=32260 RepID=UPI001C9C8976|nr:mitochondrial inner membrane protein OXA1L isoform X2 [Venturia canescens]